MKQPILGDTVAFVYEDATARVVVPRGPGDGGAPLTRPDVTRGDRRHTHRRDNPAPEDLVSELDVYESDLKRYRELCMTEEDERALQRAREVHLGRLRKFVQQRCETLIPDDFPFDATGVDEYMKRACQVYHGSVEAEYHRLTEGRDEFRAGRVCGIKPFQRIEILQDLDPLKSLEEQMMDKSSAQAAQMAQMISASVAEGIAKTLAPLLERLAPPEAEEQKGSK